MTRSIALALETLGGWHTVAEAELRKLRSALARQTGQEECGHGPTVPENVGSPSEGKQCNDQ